jgi:AcrR family transcriptional regulator
MVALRQFAEHGIAGTSISAVLAEAGLTESDIAPPIETPADLLVAASEVLLAEHLRAVQEAFGSTDNSWVALERLSEQLTERIAAGHDLEYQRMTIQIWGYALENEQVHRMLLEHAEPARQIMVQHFEQSQRLGHMRDDLDASSVFGFLNAIWNGVILQSQTDPHFDAVAVIRTAGEIYQSGLFVPSSAQ